MTWMQYGPGYYDIESGILSNNITPKDIANSLAKLNRFTGHSREPYSVARHSVFVSRLLDICPWEAMYGLVHDVAETVVQDISWPLKQVLPLAAREALDDIEDDAATALFNVLRVPYPIPDKIAAAVKRADWVAVATEKRDLLDDCPRMWDMLREFPTHRTVTPTRDWKADAREWMERYLQLARHLDLLKGD